MIYWKLFLAFLQIGLLSFGGGYAALPLIHHQIVLTHGWLTEQTFNDLVAISQMTPGPISINAATFVGLRVGGIPGAIIATLGCILPSCIIVLIIALAYRRYRNMPALKTIMITLRPVIVVLIGAAGFNIVRSAFFDGASVDASHFNIVAFVLFGLCIGALQTKKISPVAIILGAGAVFALISVCFGLL